MDRVRVIVASVQQTLIEAGATVDPPTTVATVALAVHNPLAGRGRVEDLGELEELGREASALLAERALAVLASVGLSAADVRGYGKGAIVGTDGVPDRHPKIQGRSCQSPRVQRCKRLPATS